MRKIYILLIAVFAFLLSFASMQATNYQYDTSGVFSIKAKPNPAISGNGTTCYNSIELYRAVIESNMQYNWTVSGGTIPASSSLDSVFVQWNGGSSGTLTLVKINSITSCRDSSFITVNINPLPTPSITSPVSTVCINHSQAYSCPTPPGGTTILWKAINGSITGSATETSANISWGAQSSGTVSVIWTNSNGCIDSSSSVITIYPLPTPLMKTAPIDVCAGSQYTYQDSLNVPNTSNKWEISGGNINGADDGASVNVTWGTGSSGTVTLVQTNTTTNCSDSVIIFITINPMPTPTITGNADPCVGSTLVYNCNSSDGLIYKWSVVGGTIVGADNLDSLTVSWNSSVSGTVTLIQTTGTGCTASYSIGIYVHPLPITQIVGNDMVLLNSEVIYIAETPGGTNNNWSVNSNGNIIGSTTDLIFKVKWEQTGTGKVFLIQSTQSGCIGRDTLSIGITQTIPPLTINAGSDKAVCTGEGVQIGNANAANGGVSPYRLKWTPSLGLSNDTIPNPMAIPANATNYILMVRDSRDSVKKDSVFVTVNAKPTPQIIGNSNPKLDANEIYTAVTPAGTSNRWDVLNGTAIGDSTSNSFEVRWDIAGNGKVILKQKIDATGCFANDTILVVIAEQIPGLSVNAGVDKSICEGGSTSIGSTNPASGGTPPYRYKWTPSAGLSNDTIPDPIANPGITTNFKLTVTDSRDSVAVDSITVVVNALPNPQITGSTSLKIGTVTIYSANTPNGTSNKWSVELGTVIGSATGNTLQVSWDTLGTGKVFLEQTITLAGCKSADTISVIVSLTVPQLVVNAGADKSICEGDSVQIGNVNAASGGMPPYSYQWNPSNGLSDNKVPNPFAKPIQTTIYRLRVTDSQDSLTEDDVTVTVNPIPGKPVITSPDAFIENNKFYTCNSAFITLICQTNYNGYNWLKDGVSTGITANQIVTNETGFYSLIVNNQSGCLDTSTVEIARFSPAITIKPEDVAENPGEQFDNYFSLPIKRISFSPELLNACIPDSLYLTMIIENSLFLPKDRPYRDSAEWRLITVADRIDINQEDLVYVDGTILLGDTLFSPIILKNISWGKYGTIGITTNALEGKFELIGISEAGGTRLLRFKRNIALVQILPDLITDEMELIIQSNGLESADVTIFNTLGQLIQSSRINLKNGTNTRRIVLSKNIPFGLYRVCVSNLRDIDSKSVIIGK